MTNQGNKGSSSQQIEEFRRAAHEISGETSEADFDRALGQIGHAKIPKDDVKPADKQKHTKRRPLKVAAGEPWDK